MRRIAQLQLGMERADEAAGICAKLLAAEATSAVNKAPRAIKRGKLADIDRRTPSKVGANPISIENGKPHRDSKWLESAVLKDSSNFFR